MYSHFFIVSSLKKANIKQIIILQALIGILFLLLILRQTELGRSALSHYGQTSAPKQNKTQYDGVNMGGFLGSFWKSISNLFSGKELDGPAWCEKYISSHSSSGGGSEIAVDPRRAFQDPCVVALSIAAHLNDLEGIQKALEAGADSNMVADIPGGKSITPIVFSILAKDTSALKALLAAGASPSAIYQDKTSPLYFAISRPMVDFVKTLLDAGADPNDPAPSGSLLGHAMINGRDEAFDLLLQKGANPNGTHDDDPLVENAVYWETLQYLPKLFDAGAPISAEFLHTFCSYVKNAAKRLDTSRPGYRNYVNTWKYLDAKGIKVPCERINVP